jgi:hypothetical protein
VKTGPLSASPQFADFIALPLDGLRQHKEPLHYVMEFSHIQIPLIRSIVVRVSEPSDLFPIWLFLLIQFAQLIPLEAGE